MIVVVVSLSAANQVTESKTVVTGTAGMTDGRVQTEVAFGFLLAASQASRAAAGMVFEGLVIEQALRRGECGGIDTTLQLGMSADKQSHIQGHQKRNDEQRQRDQQDHGDTAVSRAASAERCGAHGTIAWEY